MVILPQKIYYWVALICFACCLTACASYPDDPKEPNAVDDEYSVREDGFLNVPKEEGILINDTAGEGTLITLTTLDESETAEGGRIVLVEDGSFTYQPKADFHGTDQAIYTIKNDKGKTASGIVYLNVIPENDPPSIAPIADQTTEENTAAVIDFSITDADSDPDALVITTESDNTILVPDDAMTIERDGGAYRLSVLPAADQYGSATITITVTDGSPPYALTAQTGFVLTVTPGNSPPTIETIEDQITNWRNDITVAVIIGDDETPADQLELSGASSNEELVDDSSIVFYGTGNYRTAIISPNRFSVGDLTIYITVTDGGDNDGNDPLSTTESFVLTIESPFGSNQNQTAPTAANPVSTRNLMVSQSGKTDAAGRFVRMTATDILLAFHSGEITVNGDGRITYTPQSESAGRNFVLDLKSGCEPTDGSRQVSSLVECGFPAVEPDLYVTATTQMLELSGNDGLLANDRDPGGLDLTIAEPGLFDTLFGGTVQVWSDGSFSYAPPVDYQGSDGFTYSVTNGVNSVMGIAIISITP